MQDHNVIKLGKLAMQYQTPRNFMKDPHKMVVVSPWTAWIFWFLVNFIQAGKMDCLKDRQKI